MTAFEALMPEMHSQCFSCANWFELNDMWSCHDCGDCEVRCKSCHLAHGDMHVDDEADDEVEEVES